VAGSFLRSLFNMVITSLNLGFNNDTAELPSCETTDEQAELATATLQNMVPVANNSDRIFKLMEETFHFRQHWIKGDGKTVGPTLRSILTKFPRFIDVPGLVCNDKLLVVHFGFCKFHLI
jgi:hypothetical protein